MKIFNYLVSKGANMNTANKINGWTPLIAASIYARDDIVKLLIKCGVDINARNNYVLFHLFFF